MNSYTKYFAALAVMAVSQFALAQSANDCPRPDPMDMQLDGATASENQVMEAESSVRAYNDAVSIYMQCLVDVAQTAPDEDQMGLLDRYNEVAAELQTTLNNFNTQARIYNARLEESPFAAAETAADCPRPDAVSLNLDGNTANEAQMREAQATVQTLVSTGEFYKECLREVAKKVAPDEQDALVELYNGMSEEVQSTSEDFNVQVRAYLARTEAAVQSAQ